MISRGPSVPGGGTLLEALTAMRPSDALRELFEQHEALRTIMDDCEQAADDIDAGRGDFGRLARDITKLRMAFEAHNIHEETLLPKILRELDAFGDVRVSYMVADHIDEHRALRARLDGPTADLRSALYSLRAHLAGEERMFLSSRVLRDDVVAVEGSG